MKKQSFNTLLSLTAAAVLTVFAGQAHAENSTDLAETVKQNRKLIHDNDQRISEVRAKFGLHQELIDSHANLITAGQQNRQELARKNTQQDEQIKKKYRCCGGSINQSQQD
ncbi:hypothetical protein [Neisseria dumasiana]|uniref:Adhesin n=1 Tax=Neisseria dumasiana TaxID=1931275 RepID=A0ABX3WKY2_9NEIS|nr:hypothetical protein [Neisseria dumasiana]OSI32229.1 hypothetical protein BV913_09870 [Neisseria dumasiana]UOO84893.1 hypothetical protein LVJ88_02460 [Neisseria dumasiana]